MAGKKGRSGRAIIPDDVKEKLGYRKDRINKNRPAVVQKAFAKEPLDGAAAEFFATFFPPLYEGGVLSDTDSPAFHTLCRVYGYLHEADAALASYGLLLFTEKGIRPHAALKNFLQLSELYLRLLREFGLTPASRSGVVAPAVTDVAILKSKKVAGGKPTPGKGYAGKDLD